MKKLLIILLLLPLVCAQPADWFQAAIVKTQLNVSSTIDLVPRGPSPFVEAIKADVIFVPQGSEFVAVRKFEAVPAAIATGDRVRFDWKTPAVGELSYRYVSLVETANNVPRVYGKIPFPVQVPKELGKYILPTQNIDSKDAQIVSQAYALAQGEDDLFLLVSKLAIWVKNNVNYNLSTLTAEVSQPASWVLENRYGVCDELTSLFIAMLRALKVPARFVSGVAFTSSAQFPQGWGAHGWAEVYFPGVGWVPFDPTFGELGWIDPGHIKLKESLDPQEPTTVFEWKARDADVKVHDLKLSAQKVSSEGTAPFELKLSAAPFRPRVGFGSHNGIVLNVENLADYYVGAEFALTRVTDMTVLNGETQQIVLPPHGTGRVFWKLRVRENLDPNFQYEIPIQIYTIRNDSASSSFAVGRWDVVFSLADVNSEIERLSVSKRDALDLACAPENDMIWTDVGRINCAVQNRGDAGLSATVCLKECREVSVPARQSLSVSFDVGVEIPGPHQVEVTATSAGIEKKAVLTLVRLDRPHVAIKNIVAPQEVAYGDSFELSFTLARESVSIPQNVTVAVEGGGAKAALEIGALPVDQDVTINIRSDQLYSSYPSFSIDASYADPFGKEYESADSISVRVSGVPWYKRAIGWIIRLF